jgi:hypothetical protein
MLYAGDYVYMCGIDDGIYDDYIYNNAFFREQYLYVECEYEDLSVKNTCKLLAWHMETNLPKNGSNGSKNNHP